MSIWRYNPAEDDYEEIPPDEQESLDAEYDYCDVCQYVSCCELQCAETGEKQHKV